MESEQNGWKIQWMPMVIGFMIPMMLAGIWFLYRKINGIETTTIEPHQGINYAVIFVMIVGLSRYVYLQRKQSK